MFVQSRNACLPYWPRLQPVLLGFVTVKPRCSGKFSKPSNRPLKLPEAAGLNRAEFPFLTRFCGTNCGFHIWLWCNASRPISLHTVVIVLSGVTLDDGFVHEVTHCARSNGSYGGPARQHERVSTPIPWRDFTQFAKANVPTAFPEESACADANSSQSISCALLSDEVWEHLHSLDLSPPPSLSGGIWNATTHRDVYIPVWHLREPSCWSKQTNRVAD